MTKKAVLFDVDGTLIRTGGAGSQSLARGVAAALGVDVDVALAAAKRIDFRGGTDAVLIEALAAELGHVVEGLRPDIVREYLAAMADMMTPERVLVQPGIHDLLVELERCDDVIVGLLTGNLRAGARCKLAPVGLAHLVERPGGFAEDGRERAAIARAAVARVVSHGGREQAVIVVGDTERDVHAARAAGAFAVAVETGWTDRSVLEASQPDLVLPDLTHTERFLDLLARL